MEEQQKYLQSIINNATYHPMNPDADVTCQTVNLFSSDKYFIYFISDVPHYIQWNQHKLYNEILHCLYNPGKGRCTRYMWSNDMFVLWNRISAIFMKIENTVYTSFQNSSLMDWFLTSETFRITSLLNLNEYQCYHHLDLSVI